MQKKQTLAKQANAKGEIVRNIGNYRYKSDNLYIFGIFNYKAYYISNVEISNSKLQNTVQTVKAQVVAVDWSCELPEGSMDGRREQTPNNFIELSRVVLATPAFNFPTAHVNNQLVCPMLAGNFNLDHLFPII